MLSLDLHFLFDESKCLLSCLFTGLPGSQRFIRIFKFNFPAVRPVTGRPVRIAFLCLLYKTCTVSAPCHHVTSWSYSLTTVHDGSTICTVVVYLFASLSGFSVAVKLLFRNMPLKIAQLRGWLTFQLDRQRAALFFTMPWSLLAAFYWLLLAGKLFAVLPSGRIAYDMLIGGLVVLGITFHWAFFPETSPDYDLVRRAVAWNLLLEFLFRMIPHELETPPTSKTVCLVVLFLVTVILVNRLLCAFGLSDDLPISSHFLVSFLLWIVQTVNGLALAVPSLGYNPSVGYILWLFASWGHSVTSCTSLALLYGAMAFLLWYRFYVNYQANMALFDWTKKMTINPELISIVVFSLVMVLTLFLRGLLLVNLPLFLLFSLLIWAIVGEVKPAFDELLARLLGYKATTEDLAQDYLCPICLEALICSGPTVKVPACRHFFHPDCLRPWAKKHSNCPICRGPL